ncbi:MAG: methylmalonyl-CoA mutase small subunit [Bacteroidetes bacterium]|nr:methylmalonyl-CoA mutase small subunit [Bacteroidota bacterium]
MTDNKKLFTEFPPISTTQWEAAIEKDLKGADYAKKLVWRTNDGFEVRPYYRQEDLKSLGHLGSKPGEFPYVRGTKDNNDWWVRQSITVTNAGDANKSALDVLMKGVTSLNFVINNKDFSATDLDTLLKEIDVTALELNFSGCGVRTLAELFVEKLKKDAISKEVRLNVSFDIDPIVRDYSLKGSVACKGTSDSFAKFIASLISKSEGYKGIRFVTVNGNVFADSGSTIVQELSFALSVGHEYLVVLMEQGGLTIDQAAKTIKFNFAISPIYFMEIAKFRSARMLWANIVKAYSPKSECSAKIRAHAITAMSNMTVYDPYVNMLRGTTEAMSAAVGGASSIEVRPFNSIYETPTEFSNRIARNVQLLLKEDSHFDQVVDPAGGSYYVENLTQSIVDNVWSLFKKIEDKGGYISALKEGFITEQVEVSADKRRKNLATRREILLGTNQYPNFTEKISPKEKDVKKCSYDCDAPQEFKPLRPFRLGEPFEKIRLAVDSLNKTPKVMMLTVGNLTMARARSQFASNFFGCAGFQTVDYNLYPSVKEGVENTLKNDADIIVICSSDEDYITLAPEAMKLIDGKAILVVAGAPACADELKAQGITNFINVRSNVLDTLNFYMNELGINK